MADQEKRAWIVLSIILITLAAFFALVSFGWKLDSISLSVFAVVGFLGFRRHKRRPGEVSYDERDRQIERQALLSSMCLFYALLMAFSVAASFTHGWDATVPIWLVVQIFWAVSLVIWAIKALIIIVLYRRSAHA
jgi:uncharacterized membrane protein